ncbi:MAG: hypothetical protein R3F33_02190 [Planctomycetota bacterium]
MKTLIPKHRRRSNSGLTLMEVAVAMPIVAMALEMLLQILTAGNGLRSVNRDNWVASNAAQDALEWMRNADFHDLFVLYNDNPLDDPNGPGTAPGMHFDVPGLTALPSDADGHVGRILIPAFNAGSDIAPDWQLREDMEAPELGLPRDLNGDCIIDAANHGNDYSIFPVQIELQWRGQFGNRLIRFHTIFAELKT